MNTRFVETFVVLARVGSVRRAAALLNATPGTISMRIRALEDELGVALFRLDRRTLRITADGSRLLRHAESLVEATRTFHQAAKSKTAISGRIRIGIVETTVHTFMPNLMKALAAQLPDVEVDLRVDLTAQLGEQLMRREVDLILHVAGDGENPYIVSDNLVEIPMHWIARRGLIPARNPLDKVLGKQLLTLMHGTIPYESAASLVRRLSARQGIPANDLRLAGSPSLAALVSLVREGVAVAIMPGIAVWENLQRGELVRLSLPLPDPYRLAASYPKNALPAVSKVVEVTRRTVNAYCRKHGADWVRALE